MKSAFQALALSATLLASHSALAEHAYHDENCKIVGNGSMLASRTYAGYFSTSPNAIHVVGAYVGKSGVAQGEETAGGETVFLKIVSESKRTKKKYDDGCWVGFEGKFTRKVTVKSITDSSAKELKIATGQALTLSCDYEDISPELPGCRD